MEKRNLSIQGTTRQHGQRIEGLISCHFSKLLRDAEGIPSTLPFINNAEELSRFIDVDRRLKEEIEQASQHYPFRIPTFYLDLIEKDNPFCPLRRQAIPFVEELADKGKIDPLNEKEVSVTPSFIKRYPDRGVFLATSQCAMYCRFCNRRRFVGKRWDPKLFWRRPLNIWKRIAK